jgi:hypothetical protein
MGRRADGSLLNVIRVRGWGTGQEEKDLRILNHILGLLGLIGMRYTGKRVYPLSSLMYVPPCVLNILTGLEGEADE